MKGSKGLKALVFLVACLTCGCVTGKKDFVACHVESNPPSAEVWVGGTEGENPDEGEHVDTTPCDLLFYKPGEYRIFFKKSGYLSLMRRVTVVERPDEESGGDQLDSLPKKMSVTLDPIDDAGGGTQDGNGGTTTKPYYE